MDRKRSAWAGLGRPPRQLRRPAQVFFLVLNCFIGLQFILFVRYFQSGGSGIRVPRPAGVEGWIPIAGLMNLKYLLTTGSIPSIHPAAMFLLICFLLMSLLFRKAFCSWLCPIGTVSEALWQFGRKLFKRNWRLPRAVDVPLRSLKYILLGLFVYAVAGMTARAIEAFLSSPYGLVADVKMLHFFRNLSGIAAIVIALLIVLSIAFQNFWCRYLCPYGALMGIAALFSPSRITRNEDRCTGCGICTRTCPSVLKVDGLVQVRSAECTGCMECVRHCPSEGALQMYFLKKHRLSEPKLAAGLAILFFGIVGYAVLTGAWQSPIPDIMYEVLIPRLDGLSHP